MTKSSRDEMSQAGQVQAASTAGDPARAAHARPAAPHLAARPRGVPGNERLCAFSDGVFAIAITLLVFSLQVPGDITARGLVTTLPALLPKLAGHVITFAILGIYWVGHHNMFLHVRHHDRSLLWLNNLFLLFISAMPFLTGLIAQDGNDRYAVIAYASTLVLAGVSLDLIWVYASHGHRLISPAMDGNVIRFVHRRVLTAPALYLLAIALSFVSVTAAKVIFFVVAVAYILPDPMDHIHHRQFHRPDDRPAGEEPV